MIKKAHFSQEAFSPEKGTLSPTLKLKRQKVHTNFEDAIIKLYDNPS
jgi:long-subunit acyl-CoA synthetase (AMP-forming)